ncbi:CHAT domain-containing protein [Streptomyces bullii]|uniref:CHAT domain-containing protein n=1 Tax=Streptomyces bullii TaxID=349910 RepID=A0ABW0ULD8_9ACTN
MRDDSGWARAELLAERLGRRLEVLHTEGVQDAVLDPAALAEADELRAFVLRGPERDGGPLLVLDRFVLAALAHLHHARCVLLGPDSVAGRPEAQRTLTLFALVARFAPQEVPEDLRQAVATVPVPPVEDLESLSLRALEVFAHWQTAGDADALDEAIALWRSLDGLLATSHPERAMILSNLGCALRFRHGVRGDETDLVEAVALGRQSLELASPDDPGRAMYLANLCGALTVWFALNEDPAALDAAVDAGLESVRVAPEPQALFHSNAGFALLLRYERTAALTDLDTATEELRRAVHHAAPGDPQRPVFLANLGRALDQRFLRHGRQDDLDAAVDAARRAVAECPPGRPGHHGHLVGLSGILRTRAGTTGATADLDAAVDTARRALATVPAASSDRTGVAGALALALRLRFRWLRRRADIDEAVALLRESTRGDSAPEHFYDLGRILLARFREYGEPADVADAIEALRHSVRRTEEGTQRGVPLTVLGEALLARAQWTGSPDDAEEAVAALRGARALLTGFHPGARVTCLSYLGLALSRRFDLTTSPADLDEAIGAFEEAIALQPDDPDSVVDESHLGAVLMRRFNRRGDPDDLEAAVRWNRRAFERLTGEDDPHAGQVLFNLGRTLQTVYQQSDDLAVLDESVERFEGALRADDAPRSRHSSPMSRAMTLSNLGAVLRVRAERQGTRADLDRSVELSRAALTVLPHDHRDRATYLSNLCTTLLARYSRYGAQEDLAEAIRASRESVDATPATDTSARVVHLTNLGTVLRRRHELSGALADLDEAIEAHRAAVAALPDGQVDGALHLGNLALALLSRHRRTRSAADLDEGIKAARAAADATPDGHPQRGTCLSNLALALRRRFHSTGRRADAAEAVECLRHAVRLCPAGHPQRALLLSNLAMALMSRCGDGDPWAATDADADDVAEAARAARAALRISPEGDPQRFTALVNLASALVMRSRVEGDPDDLLLAYDLYRETTGVTTAPASVRLRAARAWGRAAGAAGDWNEALDAHRAAVAELPLVAWHGLDREDRIDALGRAVGLAGEAAAAALNAGRSEEALRLLEQGRGVLLAQALDARDDMTDLRERDPRLADRIREIRTLLETSGPDPNPASGADPARLLREQRRAAEQRRELAREMDELVDRARRLPGLEDFLRLPSLERLRDAAEHGPVVVVNTSTLRCDALVVTRAGLHVVPLPDLRLTDEGGLLERAEALLDALAALGRSPADAWRAQRVLTHTLAWLWDVVAEPVLATLREPTGSRLWWCPTGLLSLLPLHAAGHYGPAGDGSRVLPDRYVCSYTTTLRALATQAREHRATAGARMLAVDQSDTPGLPPLPHAREEVRKLAGRIPGATVLTGPKASRRALLHALPGHAFLHFSGHGTQDPSDSAGGALYLHDHEQAGPLTVSDISRLRLEHARLAFLSACETARGTAVLPDEAVHLAGSLQLAGFTHVVAAQWAVDDACALRVAESFYTGLRTPDHPLDPSRAAHALHDAVHDLRRRNADPLWWAAYVHTGP